MRLKDRVAIVTGASRGIGKGILLAYAREGAKVVAAARTEQDIQTVAEEAKTLGTEAIAIPTDVGKKEDIWRMVHHTVQTFGHLDILVNNAGINIAMGAVQTIDDEKWERTLLVNLTSVFWSTQAALEVMLPRKYGRIINISTIAGKIGFPYGSPYAAAKEGVIGFTRSVALEVAKEGITINCICPGWVYTPIHYQWVPKFAEMLGKSYDQMRKEIIESIPINRILEVDDLLGLAVYLASDDSAAMTGQSINLSGGQCMA